LRFDKLYIVLVNEHDDDDDEADDL